MSSIIYDLKILQYREALEKHTAADQQLMPACIQVSDVMGKDRPGWADKAGEPQEGAGWGAS